MTTALHPGTRACCGDAWSHRYNRRHFMQLGAAAGLSLGMPSLVLGAEGNYESMLLICIDPRFSESIIKYMQSCNMIGKYSQFTITDAAVGVVARDFKTSAPAPWDNLAASIQLHHIPKVIAVNPPNGGAEKAVIKDVDTHTHKASLMEFKKQVAQQPKLQVELGLMALDGSVEMFSWIFSFSPQIRSGA
jgi:hypothetical protein